MAPVTVVGGCIMPAPAQRQRARAERDVAGRTASKSFPASGRQDVDEPLSIDVVVVTIS
jgi:hypothetical protein